jgi:hypothetical protein
MKKLIVTILIIVGITGGISVIGQSSSKIDERPLKDRILTSDRYYKEGKGEVAYSYISTEKVKAEKNNGRDEIVDQRTPNSRLYEVESNKFIRRFYQEDQFFKDGSDWYQIEYATTTDLEFAKLSNRIWDKLAWVGVALATTFYSAVGDGVVEYTDATFATAQGASVGEAVDYTSAQLYVRVVYSILDGGWIFDRMFLPFNTSALPSNAIVTGATLGVFADTVVNGSNDGNDIIRVVETSQASRVSLVTTDYNKAGATTSPTALATDVDMTTMSTTTYTTFNLNSTGLSKIKKIGETPNCSAASGTTCLGLRIGHDFNNTEPPVGLGNGARIYMSEQTGTSNDPYLDVSYVLTLSESELIFFD